MKKLLIVIVSYKATDLTIECLHSLEPELQSLPNVSVVVVENGTSEFDVQRLSEKVRQSNWEQWCSIIALPINLGFTGGNNAALDWYLNSDDPPQYFLLLNSDTIVRSGAIINLLRFMDSHPGAGIAGSRLDKITGEVACSAFKYITWLSEFERGIRLGFVSRLLKRWRTWQPIPSSPQQVDWVSGACLIVRSAVFKQTGTLDEDLYTYFDDVDLCLNAHRAGWQTWYVPESCVVHYEGMTTGMNQPEQKRKRRPDYWFQARRHYFLKNMGRVHTVLADAAFLLGYSLWKLRCLILPKSHNDPHLYLWDSLRHSVFCTGLRIEPVKNPLLTNAALKSVTSIADNTGVATVAHQQLAQSPLARQGDASSFDRNS